ncbi:HEAT repeat domain-containing protein [Myxococcus sp. Y35]|uniref:HEAT repeat domain-containing protein n=1 Tax=Pseudomyxococcus flavus TaxID=3115648 RepID=UPI003CF44BA0
MSPRLKSLVLLLAVLVGAAVWHAGTWTRRPDVPPAATGETWVPEDGEALSLPEDLRQGVKGQERTLVVGHRLRYTFDLDVRTSTQHVDGTREQAHTGWSGLLELTYLGAEGEQHLFSGLVVPTRVDLEGGEPAPPRDDVLRALQAMFERPMYVAQESRGRVVAVHFDAAQDAMARRLVRRLLAATQFVAEDGTRWSTEESDTRGDFESEYRAGGSANTYVKTKRRYLRASSPVLPRLQGHLAFTLFTDGHVREAVGSDVVELGGADAKRPRVREETRVALINVGVDYQLSSLRPFQAARATLHPERLPASAAPRASHERESVRGETLKDLLRRMATRKNRDAIHSRLAALFHQDAGEVNQAVELIRRGATDEVRSEQVLEALASAGTPEAQRALTSVLEATQVRPKTRAHAARAVGEMERPTLLLADALSRALEEEPDAAVRDAAALSMGALSKALELSEPGRSKALLEELLRSCRSGIPAPKVCLSALARAGSPLGMAYVKSALLHPDATVRGAATDALRAIPGASADVLLDHVMLNDPSAQVRTLAVKAVAHRVATAHLEALAQALRTERSERVRIEVVRLLGALQEVEAPARALLHDVAQYDTSGNVRALASALLGE